MKHNQFKHIVNQIIKEQCQVHNLRFSGVDINNNSKVIYVYDQEWKCVLTIKLWMNETEIHITGSTNTENVAGICNEQYRYEGSYLQFQTIFNGILLMFQQITN